MCACEGLEVEVNHLQREVLRVFDATGLEVLTP